jgi:hypothetical protein
VNANANDIFRVEIEILGSGSIFLGQDQDYQVGIDIFGSGSRFTGRD